MKTIHYIAFVAICLAMGSFSMSSRAFAAEITPCAVPADTVQIIRTNAINAKIAAVEKEIALQDKKRNATYIGVSPEVMEQINDKQDSICLDLRSQLVTLQLQLNAIK